MVMNTQLVRHDLETVLAKHFPADAAFVIVVQFADASFTVVTNAADLDGVPMLLSAAAEAIREEPNVSKPS